METDYVIFAKKAAALLETAEAEVEQLPTSMAVVYAMLAQAAATHEQTQEMKILRREIHDLKIAIGRRR